jgi:phosphogluconate dehydratase
MTDLNPTLARVTARIRDRSAVTRSAYLARIEAGKRRGPHRGALSCGNLAHGFAACSGTDKTRLAGVGGPNIGIVTSYNDMLSAHQPLGQYPDLIKAAVHQAGATAQVAGGVPAMCDGVTQGQPGMELSLFSRDVIAQATAVALSHNMFDAALCLGVCDKIVPGLLMGALAFGHLPVIFVPGGPMPSGLPNKEKARVRQLFEEGKVGRRELLDCESKSYHAPGTCTFYGTANSNQMLMEVMGLHLPGAAFVNPGTPLRDALTRAAAVRALEITALTGDYRPIGHIVDERAIANGIVGLLATGGSTNHTIHLVAAARIAGIRIDWEDFDELSSVVPLLARIYPNGPADVNHFHAAGGLAFLIRELLDAGLLHRDVLTVSGEDLSHYTREPVVRDDGKLAWRESGLTSHDPTVVRPAAEPFSPDGGMRVLRGNLGRAVTKVSAVSAEHRVVEAPARVFDSQDGVKAAFVAGELDGDVVCIVRFQGPKANGMPELHKLTPALGVLQDRGFNVALVTDGRMSGASGKVPAAIHLTPEGVAGGEIAKIRDGDPIRLDAETGVLDVLIPDEALRARTPASPDLENHGFGMGRELFSTFREHVHGAEQGASVITS